MSSISIFFTLFFYFSVLIFITGLSYKIVQYWNTPAPLKIPIAPAPLTKSGVFLRLTKEVFLFATLFKSSKWTWLFGWSFHLALVLLFFRHLVYFWPGEIPLLLLKTEPSMCKKWNDLFGVHSRSMHVLNAVFNFFPFFLTTGS